MGARSDTTSPHAFTDDRARVALVHDFLVDLRGAERVFLKLCEIWPNADLFTTVYDEDGTEGRFAARNLHCSFLQRLRPSARNFRVLLPLYPAAIESFDLSSYDLVISSSSAWAHAVICDERTLHVCYCHNPFRYAWNDRDRTLARQHDPLSRAVLRGVFRRWRQWDWVAAQRTDRYVANSRATQGRISNYFGREASVVYPPVDTVRFSPGAIGEHYLIVSELMAHKQIDVAIAAFNRLGLPLVIVGDGPENRRLRRLAAPNIQFAGRLADGEVASLLQSARALVVPSVEEFGLAAVESQAAGRPVIARRGGGALETVIDGVTGCFWDGGAAELAKVVSAFDDLAVDAAACARNAARFSVQQFRSGIVAEVQRAGSGRPAAAAEHPPRVNGRSHRRRLPSAR